MRKALSERLKAGDVLIVTHKIVSKAEGRVVDLRTVEPSDTARGFAEQWGKDARQVELEVCPYRLADVQRTGVIACTDPPQVLALNVPTRRTYTVQYPTRAALGVRIAYDNLADGEWVHLVLPYPYGKFVMHRDGDNFIPVAPVSSLAELDVVPRATFYYAAAAQVVHVKLVAKAGEARGAVWMETRD